MFNLKKRRTAGLDQGAFVVPPGKRAFNDTRAKSEITARNMTWFGAVSLLIALAAVICGGIGYSHPRPVPLAMFIQGNGHGVKLTGVADDLNFRDEIVKKQLTAFTTAVFTRTGSMIADRTRIKEDVLPLMAGTDASYVTINGRFADPVFNLKTATTLANVTVDTPQKRAADSWYVKWTVTTLKVDNTVVSTQSYDATVVTKFNDPGSEDQVLKNPTGLEVTTFPYQPISGDTTQ